MCKLLGLWSHEDGNVGAEVDAACKAGNTVASEKAKGYGLLKK